jgi:nucleotide-binding universal stress UspA family protein
MKPLRHILAATDFSEDGGRAVARACQLARTHAARLSLLHVINASTLSAMGAVFRTTPDIAQRVETEAERALDEAAAPAQQSGCSVSVQVRVGGVIEELLAAAQACDLLVVGAHGLNPMRDAIIGTTAERLLGQCTRPLLVVRGEGQRPYRGLVVAVDFSMHSAASLALAARIVPGAEMHVVHAYDVPFEGKLWLAGVGEERKEAHRAEIRDQALRDMSALVGPRVTGQPAPRLVVERGEAPPVILDTAQRTGAECIVIGRQGRSKLEAFFLGSVTRHVLAGAACDVLVVP